MGSLPVIPSSVLSIIDPNDSTNDIAGGSRNTAGIMYSFAEAYGFLQRRMREVSKMDGTARKNASLLSVIFEGNYSSFRVQREHLRALHAKGRR